MEGGSRPPRSRGRLWHRGRAPVNRFKGTAEQPYPSPIRPIHQKGEGVDPQNLKPRLSTGGAHWYARPSSGLELDEASQSGARGLETPLEIDLEIRGFELGDRVWSRPSMLTQESLGPMVRLLSFTPAKGSKGNRDPPLRCSRIHKGRRSSETITQLTR